MNQLVEHEDSSFVFDTCLLTENDLAIYADLISELARVTRKKKKLTNHNIVLDAVPGIDRNDAEQSASDINDTHLTEEFSEFFCYLDKNVMESNDFSREQCASDMKETHLTEELSQIFSYFDEDVMLPNDENNDSEDKFESSSDFRCKIKGVIYKRHKILHILEENEFEALVCKPNEKFSDQFNRTESVSDRNAKWGSNLHSKLYDELGVGNVKEKVLMYNKMIEEVNKKIEIGKNVLPKHLENIREGIDIISDAKECDECDDFDETITSRHDLDILQKYLEKLSAIETYAHIIHRLKRLVLAFNRLDDERLHGMNPERLNNFFNFVKLCADECHNRSSAYRMDIDKDLEKNLLTPDNLVYCVAVVSNEVNILNPAFPSILKRCFEIFQMFACYFIFQLSQPIIPPER